MDEHYWGYIFHPIVFHSTATGKNVKFCGNVFQLLWHGGKFQTKIRRFLENG